MRARARLAILGASVAAAAAAAGCASVGAREAVLRNAARDGLERVRATRPIGEGARAVIARQGMTELARHDPAAAAGLLEGRMRDRPEPDGALALAELSHRAGLEREHARPAEALQWYRDAAVLAAVALGEPGGASEGAARQVHDESVRRLIRLCQARRARGGGTWQQALAARGLVLADTERFLDPRRFADLKVVDDIQVQGMDHVYKSPGLGVPLVAHRLVDPDHTDDPQDQFEPRQMRFGATAAVIPGGGLAGGAWRSAPATLEFFDPFLDRAVDLGGRSYPLAGDRTTALALQVAEGRVPSLELTGLLQSEFRRDDVGGGLYMLRPYERGKVPVVLVHGLFSSPRSWVQTINELRNDPDLAGRCQFWVFLYPTGQPIPASAARLRDSLRRAREVLDPEATDAAMGRMVVVGHSMGGVLAKMMAQDPGRLLWDMTLGLPPERLQAPPELRGRLESYLIFRPVSTVARVVFVCTPHRGSPLAVRLLGEVVSSLIRLTKQEETDLATLRELNGPGIASRDLKDRSYNSIGNLRTDSPVLAALDRTPVDPAVPYHSIIPLIGAASGNTDGVVEYGSSHLDGAASELIVEGTHFSQERPSVTAELKRILRLHLADPAMPAIAPERPAK